MRRQRLAPILGVWGLSWQQREHALLVMSELVTNAVEHAGTPLVILVGARQPPLDEGVRFAVLAKPLRCLGDEHRGGLPVYSAADEAHDGAGLRALL